MNTGVKIIKLIACNKSKKGVCLFIYQLLKQKKEKIKLGHVYLIGFEIINF